MSKCFFRVHGVDVTVSAAEPVLEAVVSRLERFPVAQSGGDSSRLRFEYEAVADLAQRGSEGPCGPSRMVLDLEPGKVHYFDGSHQMVLDVPGTARGLVDLRTGLVSVKHVGEEIRDSWLLAHPFFTVPLMEFFKSLGFYSLHAAGLAIGGRVLLITGHSGSGKTTLSIALVRAGFEFMGDDTVFLSKGGSVLAFPDEIDVTSATAGFFPELRYLKDKPPPTMRYKQGVCPSRAFNATICWEGQPAAIIFPAPSGTGESRLSPMTKGDALVELCANVLRTERTSTQAHLDVLSALVHRCRCFRLETGRDFESLADRLRAILLDPAAGPTP